MGVALKADQSIPPPHVHDWLPVINHEENLRMVREERIKNLLLDHIILPTISLLSHYQPIIWHTVDFQPVLRQAHIRIRSSGDEVYLKTTVVQNADELYAPRMRLIGNRLLKELLPVLWLLCYVVKPWAAIAQGAVYVADYYAVPIRHLHPDKVHDLGRKRVAIIGDSGESLVGH